MPSFDLLEPAPAGRPPLPGPTSRSPRGATGTAGSAPSPRSGANSGPARVESILAEVDQLGGGRPVAPGGGARGPGPLVVRPRPVGRRHGAGLDGPAVGASRPIVDLVAARGRAGPVDPSPLSVPVDPRRRPGGGHPGHRRALLRPLAPARVPAAAQAHAPVGRGGALPRADRHRSGGPSRRRPSGRRSSSATRARPRPTTTTSSSGSTRPSSTGWASSPSATRPAPTPPSSTARCPTELMAERMRECTELQDAITATRRDALIGVTVEVLVDARARGGPTGRPPRSTGS